MYAPCPAREKRACAASAMGVLRVAVTEIAERGRAIRRSFDY